MTITANDGTNQVVCQFRLSVVDVTPPTITAPDDITVPADAGSCSASPDLGMAAAGDNCDVVISNDAMPPFPVGDTVVTWTAEDVSGNTATDTQTVTVSANNQIDVEVELMSADSGPFDRCITFEVVDCDTGKTEVVEVVMTFENTGDGTRGTAALEVPCDDGSGNPITYDCITARDRLHTLRRTQDLMISGNNYLADFTSDTGKALVGGNLNDDQFIDILDFGTYTSQFSMNIGADTDCSTAAPHSDISGNGVVDLGDFTFIQVNFLRFKEDDCCVVSALAGGPVTEISVRELYRLGLGHLAVADLNNDGMLDLMDMVAFMNGARPEGIADMAGEQANWFDDDAWTDGRRPHAETDVQIDGLMTIALQGAVARSVAVQSGGTLRILDGSLAAQTMIVHAGGMLEIDGTSMLMLNGLTLEAGATLAWNGGVIEVAGGIYNQADADLLVGTTDVLSTLSLVQGASATITEHTYIGLGEGHLGLVEIDSGASLFTGRDLYVGFGGQGTLLVTDGGVVGSQGGHLGFLGSGRGEAVLSGLGSTWSVAEHLHVGGMGEGILTVLDGALVIAPVTTVGQMGVLAGDGLVRGDLVNTGVVRPMGTLGIDGDYVQSGALRLELGNFHADTLSVAGDAHLGGVLTVTLDDQFQAVPGNAFVVLTADRVSGRFDGLQLPELPQGMMFDVAYGPGSVTLTVTSVV
ncbi:MAG: HYR domain-containing protein, partial [Planctomycetota bacterium]